METQSKQRVRKSPQEQINEARAALARAQQRQRASDTRRKIIVGAICQKWLQGNAQAARAFLGHMHSVELKEQDKDTLDDFMRELSIVINDTQQQINPNEAPAD